MKADPATSHCRPKCPWCHKRAYILRACTSVLVTCTQCDTTFVYRPPGHVPSRPCIFCKKHFDPKHILHRMCGALECRKRQKAEIHRRWLQKEYLA